MEKTCNSGEPSQEWPAYQNYSKSAIMTHLIFCGLMRQKLNFLEGACPVTSGVQTNTAFHKENIISTVKHGGGSVLVWALGPGRLSISDGNMNSALYQKTLKENVWPSVCDLKLKHTWVMQQENDPKHTSKSTSEWLKSKSRLESDWDAVAWTLNSPFML